MRPEIALARLTPHPPDMTAVHSGAAAIGGTSPADIAGALSFAKLPRKVYLYALRKWCVEESVHAELSRFVYLEGVDMAIRYGWSIPKGQERVRKMCDAALDESIGSQRCSLCNGVGYVVKTGAGPRACPQCLTVGRSARSAYEIARKMGIHRSNYARVWQPRYAAVSELLHAWDCWVYGALAKQLNE